MKIHFAAFEQANVTGVAPVMRALSQRAGWEPVFIPGTDFKEHRGCLARAAGPAGVPVRVLEDELSADERARAQARGRALLNEARGWSGASTDASFNARVLAASARHRLFERGYAPELFEAYAELEAALDAFARAERPEMVVLGEDTDYLRGRLAARVLARHRIPVVCLTAFYYNVFASYPLLGERRAALYLAGNRFHAERLKRSGVASERVVVVGNPAFDEVEPDAAPARTPATFLHALQGLPWEREIATDLVAILGEASRCVLAVRPHPELSRPPWLAALATAAHVRVVEPRVAAAVALRDADCLIAQSSAMLYQAAVVGRPVIVPHYDAAPLAIHLPEADRPHVVARTKGELRRAVGRVVGGSGRALAREEVAPFHPRSTERVVDCLEDFRARLSARAALGRP